MNHLEEYHARTIADGRARTRTRLAWVAGFIAALFFGWFAGKVIANAAHDAVHVEWVQ